MVSITSFKHLFERNNHKCSTPRHLHNQCQELWVDIDGAGGVGGLMQGAVVTRLVTTIGLAGNAHQMPELAGPDPSEGALLERWSGGDWYRR